MYRLIIYLGLIHFGFAWPETQLFGLDRNVTGIAGSIRFCDDYTSCYSSSRDVSNITDVEYIAFRPSPWDKCEFDTYSMDGFYAFLLADYNYTVNSTSVMYGHSFSWGLEYLYYLSLYSDFLYALVSIMQ